jgi:hypothetical protein
MPVEEEDDRIGTIFRQIRPNHAARRRPGRRSMRRREGSLPPPAFHMDRPVNKLGVAAPADEAGGNGHGK